MKNSINKIKEQVIPLLFSVSCTCLILNALFQTVFLVDLLLAIVWNFILFIVLNKISQKKKYSGLFYLLGSIVYLFLAFLIINLAADTYSGGYLSWIKDVQNDNSGMIAYWIGTFLISTHFFSSIIFYFTEIRRRRVVLILISIIPLAIYSARTKHIISLAFIMFLIFLIGLFIEFTRNIGSEKNVTVYNKKASYYKAIIPFLIILSIIALIIPKPDMFPKLSNPNSFLEKKQPSNGNNNDDARNNGDSKRNDGPNSGGSKRGSNINTPNNSKNKSQILFDVQASEPIYFRVQSFDKYENNKWKTGNDLLEENYVFNGMIRNDNNINFIMKILSDSKKVEELKKKNSKLENILNKPSIPQVKKVANIRTNDYEMKVLLNPLGIIDFNLEGSNEKIYTNNQDMYFLKRSLNNNEKYSVSYYSQMLDEDSREFEFIKNINLQEYVEMLNTLSSLNLNTIEKQEINNYKAEIIKAQVDYRKLPSKLPNRIYDLANKITKDKTSDYDKALAIEKYLTSGEFKYKLDIKKISNNRDYTDYFLFDSKTGYCVQFASAMVILARAAGLPSKYTEGFVCCEKNKLLDTYVIRSEHAHAFPEIFIAGYGWMKFEPTASIKEDINKNDKNNKSNIQNNKKRIEVPFYKVLLIGLIVIASIPLAILIILLLIKLFINLKRHFWRQKLFNMEKNKAVEDIFMQTLLILKLIDYDIKSYETPNQYAFRIFTECFLDIKPLVNAFNKSKYGNLDAKDEQIENLLVIYDEVLAYTKKNCKWTKKYKI
ncbi:Transglutaminase-like superfamily protein [Clostridium cavendishii DSM 21758]|uniref:Transglutaminase-like superfamily protein n=1 Tax=Clostridium cavendishii DSM 21758 TaxID=1121302 RepID=A0A1M6I6N3_9CLOT|nr:transglutaminase domain-containing protein [Clostridium cavendishii]SHJ30101.1 Transglutaminase-like superfamily protein [Clostridium cavendishii DSM 21758]